MANSRPSHTKRAGIGRGPTPLPGNITKRGPSAVGEAQKAHPIAKAAAVSTAAPSNSMSFVKRRNAGKLPGASRTPQPSNKAKARIDGQNSTF